MSPTRVLFPAFRDELATTNYPFVDGATLTSRTQQALPAEMFVDASLYPIGANPRVFLGAITVSQQLVTFTLSDPLNPALATTSFNPLDPPEILAFTDTLGRPAGILIIDPAAMAIFTTWPVATQTFTVAATEFVASCVIPTPEIGVRGFLLPDGSLVAGDVWLAGDNGVIVRQDQGTIRIDIVGDPLFVRAACAAAGLFQTPNFLRTINGCGPDAAGNTNLTVGENDNSQTILRIYAVNGALQIDAVGTNQG